MRKYLILSSILFFICSVYMYAQSIDSSYKVATWRGFRKAAVTFTFDDNCSNQFSKALPLFDTYGFKMTFYPVINWSPDWNILRSAALNGHEVGSHTVSHPHLSLLTIEQQANELVNSQNKINTEITVQKCLTIAYPYCELGNDSLIRSHYIAGRGCSGAIEKSTPNNFMNISSIICGSQGLVKGINDFMNKLKSSVSSKGWVVFLIHGIDNDGGYSPISSDTLKTVLDSLDNYRSTYWIATFLNVVQYIRERNSVSINELENNDSTIVLELADTLDNNIYNCPITVQRILPDDWETAVAYQNGKMLESRIETVSSNKYIIFDVVPDNGYILISKHCSSFARSKESLHLEKPYLFQNYPNPFNPCTTIEFSLPKRSHVKISVFNTLGECVIDLADGVFEAGIHKINLDSNTLSSGVYFYELQANEYSVVKKLVVLK